MEGEGFVKWTARGTEAVQAVALRSRRRSEGVGVFLEACVERARRIEEQFLRAQGERAVTLARETVLSSRHQKVIEEAPAPDVPPEVERLLCESAARLADASGYEGVGTAEFLYQTDSQRAYFMEVNSRLQVEHTVTEMITQDDLIHAQLDIARGRSLAECGAISSDGDPVSPRGWAIQARLCAEDVTRGFAPAPGRVIRFRAPTGPGIRVDSGIVEGMEIAPLFDSMIAKIIAGGATRDQAIARLRRALEELQVVVEDGATNKSLFEL